MGDMADDFLDKVMDWEDMSLDLLYADPLEQYDAGLVDELGCFYPRGKSKKPIGEGNCPKCNKPTRLVKGKFGEFYGCSNFPRCNGSRNKG